MNRDLIEAHCLKIVQGVTPMDSGNLTFNATRSYKTHDGFNIVVRNAIAHYNNIVNAKWRGRTNPNEGYFSITAYGAVARYVNSIGNNDKDNETSNFETLTKNAKDNPLRQKRFLESLRRAG